MGRGRGRAQGREESEEAIECWLHDFWFPSGEMERVESWGRKVPRDNVKFYA